MKAVNQIGNAVLATPNSNVAQAVATVQAVATDIETLLGTTLHQLTTEVRISVRGAGDLCVRFDGEDPTGGSVGEVWYPGAIQTFNVNTARKIKMIRDGADDCVINIIQFTGGTLR